MSVAQLAWSLVDWRAVLSAEMSASLWAALSAAVRALHWAGRRVLMWEMHWAAKKVVRLAES
jgi:hypothetical protein